MSQLSFPESGVAEVRLLKDGQSDLPIYVLINSEDGVAMGIKLYFNHPFNHPSFHPSIHPSIHPFIHPSIHQSIFVCSCLVGWLLWCWLLAFGSHTKTPLYMWIAWVHYIAYHYFKETKGRSSHMNETNRDKHRVKSREKRILVVLHLFVVCDYNQGTDILFGCRGAQFVFVKVSCYCIWVICM